jgi:hypothetical protein
MTSAQPLAFPGSRPLGVWSRQLAPHQPAAFWVVHLFVHRIEALTRSAVPARADRLTLLLLEALAFESEQSLERIEERLHLGKQALVRWLRELEAKDLAAITAKGNWSLTPSGQEARQRGEFLAARQERRVFHFVESLHGNRSPHFLSLVTSGTPGTPVQEWPFDCALLEQCVQQPSAWKQQHRFPTEVTEILSLLTPPLPDPMDTVPSRAWTRVMLDQPESYAAAFVLLRTPEGECLRGFRVDPTTWTIAWPHPLVDLGSAWRDVFPELAKDLPMGSWRRAWQACCRTAGVPAAEAEACRLQRHDYRLQVEAPAGLLARLRASRHEVLRGSTWLLAGWNRFREAVLVDIVPMLPSPAQP